MKNLTQLIRERIQVELDYSVRKINEQKKELAKRLLKKSDIDFVGFGVWGLPKLIKYQEQILLLKGILVEKDDKIVRRIEYEIKRLTSSLVRLYDIMNSTDLFSNAVSLSKQKTNGIMVEFLEAALRNAKKEITFQIEK